MPAPAMAVLSISAGLNLTRVQIFAKRIGRLSLGLRKLPDNMNGSGPTRFRVRFPHFLNLHIETTARDRSNEALTFVAELRRFHRHVSTPLRLQSQSMIAFP